MRKVPVLVSTVAAAIFAGGIAMAASAPLDVRNDRDDRPALERPRVDDGPARSSITVTTIDDRGGDGTMPTIPDATAPTAPDDPSVTTPTVPSTDDRPGDDRRCDEGLETEIEDGVIVQKPHGGDRCRVVPTTPGATTTPTSPPPVTTPDESGHHDGDDDHSGPGSGADDADNSGPGSGSDDDDDDADDDSGSESHDDDADDDSGSDSGHDASDDRSGRR